MDKQPVLTIVAGANGSGKTTFAVPYTKQYGIQFINADALTKQFESRGEPNAMMKGGRAFFRLLDQALTKLEDVCIETTLSGTYTTKVVTRAQKSGYEVQMIYIFLDNAQMCVDRVTLRVKKGGHHVPIDDITRRYYRSIANFRDNFIKVADVWFLYYNGLERHTLIAQKGANGIDIIDAAKYDYLQNIETDVSN
ncbi:zeta toxin family protein [Neolewinella antarctica]|uniref:ABC-type ATPase n=1 Tax=Neolewinella antarctica TaxID=442734 RepID=A0ABX0XDH1_9BACT|nr:zeta toxin family protein [Neolewinella antarctica]NJC26939.1 putative ABC-type ATPase [Neolewinella antarctica]